MKLRTGTGLFFRALDVENVLIPHAHFKELTGSDKIAQLLVPVVHGGERAVIRKTGTDLFFPLVAFQLSGQPPGWGEGSISIKSLAVTLLVGDHGAQQL